MICITCKYSYRIENEKKICLPNITDNIDSISTLPLITEPLTTKPSTNETTEPINPITTQISTTVITTEPIFENPTTEVFFDNPIITHFSTTVVTTEPIFENPTTEVLFDNPISTQPSTNKFISSIPLTSESLTDETKIQTTEPLITHTIIKNPITTEPNIVESNQIEVTISTIIKSHEQIIYTTTIGKTNNIENITKSCSNEDIINNKCNNSKVSTEQLSDIKKAILNKNYTNNKNNTIIKTKNVIIQLSTLETQRNSDLPDISNIDFGECEKILKESNNIPSTEELIVYKTDIKSQDLSSTYVMYEVYNPYTLDKLNLSVCSEVQISISVPVILNNNIEELYDSLSQSGYNIFDGNDSFYQDICATYTTINGTDILLSDRKEDIYTESQNQAICQVGCTLKSYNHVSKKAKCDCSLNQQSAELTDLNIEDLLSKNAIEDSFYKTLANSNFQVLKCFKLLFTSKVIKNIGEILMSIIFVIFFVLMLISSFTFQRIIRAHISLILKNTLNIQMKDNNMSKKKKKEKNKYRRSLESICYTLKKQTNNGPPIRKSINNNKRKNKKMNKKAGKNNSTNFIQSNIYLNLNMFKNEKKKSHFYKYKRDSIDTKKKLKKNLIDNLVIYKEKNKRLKSQGLKSKNFFNEKKIEKKKTKTKKIETKVLDIKYKNLNDQELNSLVYELAIKYDKRTYFQYYWSLLKKKQLILFSFLPNNDYNIRTIKISLFLMSFSLYFTINGFFFTDKTMHKFYEDKGKFNIIFQIPQILYSTLVSSVIHIILKTLSLSEKNILELKENIDKKKTMEKAIKIEFCLKIKFIIFCILSFILMIFFWYFISCFCAVYVNTQKILIKDTIISFLLSMIYPFGLNLLPGIFRIPSLRAKNKNKECLYKLSTIIALI